MKFENNEGCIWRTEEWPENMTEKEAINTTIEKIEFVLSERLAGRKVIDDGASSTCGFCNLSEDPGKACRICPIDIKYLGCFHTPYGKMDDDRTKDEQYRIPHIRKALKFLKDFAENYEPTTK